MAIKETALSPVRMSGFLASLASLAPDELRKAKVLYIRNAIDEYDAQRASAESMVGLVLLFGLIPLFWPFLYIMKQTTEASLQMARAQILNAIAVWADDLPGEPFAVERLVPPKWL